MRIQYSIVIVRDMSRSVAIYRDVLGLPLRFESPHWTEFETEGAKLALHLGDDAVDPPRAVYGSRVALYADPDGLGIGVSGP